MRRGARVYRKFCNREIIVETSKELLIKNQICQIKEFSVSIFWEDPKSTEISFFDIISAILGHLVSCAFSSWILQEKLIEEERREGVEDW